MLPIIYQLWKFNNHLMVLIGMSEAGLPEAFLEEMEKIENEQESSFINILHLLQKVEQMIGLSEA